MGDSIAITSILLLLVKCLTGDYKGEVCHVNCVLSLT